MYGIRSAELFLVQGAIHIYRDYLLPFVLRHEPDVDRRLAEFRCRSTDVIARYWGDGIAFGQQMLMEGLQYVAAQAPANQVRNICNLSMVVKCDSFWLKADRMYVG